MRTTLIIPCYNEAKRLDVERFRRYIQRADTHLLFVNDGSTDATAAVLDDLAHAGARVLHLEKNCGKGEAVRLGMHEAIRAGQPEYVGFWDADLATPLEEVERFEAFLDHENALEVVTGARVKLLGRRIDRRASRHYIGRLGATAISYVLGLAVYDTQCGAKLFRNDEYLQQVIREPFISKWIFDVEMIARYQQEFAKSGREFAGALFEVPLGTWTDVAGSKVKPRDFARALIDLWRIHQAYHPRRFRRT